MQMIPGSPTVDTNSSAERRIFNKFRDLPGFDDWICLHSLRLSRSDYAACGEIDFLLIGPQGVYIGEVKGGGVSYDGHSWRHENRYGQVSFKDRGPMKQAEQAMFSLMSNLKASNRAELSRNVMFGWFVMFPDVDFNVSSSEWDGSEIIDQKDIVTLDELSEALTRMMNYWSSALRGNTGQKVLLNKKQVSELASHWRPLFDRSPSLRNMVVSSLDSSNAFTEEQYRVVSVVEKNRRLVCEGGAGTGKSFIALEIARRRRDAGLSVLFTAKNPNLLAFLAGQTDTAGISFVQYDEAISGNQKWDFVVVDEAQDLITAENELGIDRLVVGGIDTGQWFVCVDPATQTGFYGDFDPHQFGAMVERSGNLSLVENCRNTGNIVTQLGLVLNKELGSTVLAAGPPVLWSPPLGDVVSEARALENFLGDMLMKKGFQQHEVTILELNREHSPVEHLPRALVRNIERIDSENIRRWPFRGIGVSDVRDFKGLESNVVCLVGARGLGPFEDVRNMLYVAMSRARALLWIANTPEFDAAVKNIAGSQK